MIRDTHDDTDIFNKVFEFGNNNNNNNNGNGNNRNNNINLEQEVKDFNEYINNYKEILNNFPIEDTKNYYNIIKELYVFIEFSKQYHCDESIIRNLTYSINLIENELYKIILSHKNLRNAIGNHVNNGIIKFKYFYDKASANTEYTTDLSNTPLNTVISQISTIDVDTINPTVNIHSKDNNNEKLILSSFW